MVCPPLCNASPHDGVPVMRITHADHVLPPDRRVVGVVTSDAQPGRDDGPAQTTRIPLSAACCRVPRENL